MDSGIFVKAWRGLFSKGYGRDFLAGPSSPFPDDSPEIKPGDLAAQVKAYKGLVYSCVKVKANGIANFPFKLYTPKKEKQGKFRYTPTRRVTEKQRDFLFAQDFASPFLKTASGVEEITEHPILDLLRNVNGHKNAFDLKFETAMFGSLTGNCYWYLPKNGLGLPGAVFILHPQYITPKVGKDGVVTEYLYQRGGKKITYPADEIIHFTTSSPHNHYIGMGDVAGAADAIGLRGYMTDYEKSVFKNMGYPEFALKSTKTLGPEVLKSLKTQFKQNYGGRRKAASMMILEDWMSIEPLQITSPREMQYERGWTLMREEIAAGFSVPLSFFVPQGAIAVSQSDKERFGKFAVLPELTRQAEKLNEQLIPKYDGEGYFFGFDNPVPEDRELELKELTELVASGIMTIDEAREIRALSPMGIDYLLIPQTMIPIDQAGMMGQQAVKSDDEMAAQVVRVMDKARAVRMGG